MSEENPETRLSKRHALSRRRYTAWVSFLDSFSFFIIFFHLFCLFLLQLLVFSSFYRRQFRTTLAIVNARLTWLHFRLSINWLALSVNRSIFYRSIFYRSIETVRKLRWLFQTVDRNWMTRLSRRILLSLLCARRPRPLSRSLLFFPSLVFSLTISWIFSYAQRHVNARIFVLLNV